MINKLPITIDIDGLFLYNTKSELSHSIEKVQYRGEGK